MRTERTPVVKVYDAKSGELKAVKVLLDSGVVELDVKPGEDAYMTAMRHIVAVAQARRMRDE